MQKPMLQKKFLPFLLVALFLSCADAHAAKQLATGKRVALVIGNGAYKASPLRNPANDAKDVAAALRGLGFEVICKTDAGKRDMVEATRTFGRKSQGAEAALFFYAGHGMQVRGTNYLIPVDADVHSEAEVEFEGVDANRILAQMEGAGAAVNIVILDACRDNPFRSFRSATRGLAVVRAVTGSVVVYATAPGDVAADGSGRNSPFTTNLLKHMATPGLGVDAMFKRVGAGVSQQSHGGQTPWISSCLFGEFYMAGQGPSGRPQPATPAVAPPPQAQPSLDDLVAMADRKQAAELAAKEREKAKKQEALEDIKKYRALVASSPGLKDQAWQALAAKYPALLAGLASGDIEGFAVNFQPDPGGTWTDPVTGMEFVRVPGGCFKMGSNNGDADERPVHEVCVNGFWMGKYEVTQAEWRSIMGNIPFRNKSDRHPAQNVTWNDTQAFIRALNDRSGDSFRLPTEAEWEYAARSGGRDETYSGGDNVDWVAWCKLNTSSRTKPVGEKSPNGLGLHDMSGNAWEWCQDWYGENYYSHSPRNNPRGPGGGAKRVIRGGASFCEPKLVRAANRNSYFPDINVDDYGFRLLRTE